MRLEVRDLGFGYPGFPVGSGVSFELGEGDVLCLLGPNGCGKTTLFKTILGLIRRFGGSIEIGGRDIASLPRGELARQIAYVPQAHSPVFPYSVHDMVLMGRTAHRGLFAAPSADDRREAEAALEELGIADLSGREYTNLSGGQRQLVLIARALAQQAPIIVLDEPTASLDFGNQVLVLRQVETLAAAGKAVVLSTHDPDHAFAAGTWVLAMKEGRTVASGSVGETLTAEILSRVYDLPVDVAVLDDGRHVCLPSVR